jgi:hypothetical protein
MTVAAAKLLPAKFRFERRSADEHRLFYEDVYCGTVTYTASDGWDAYAILDHRYLPSGPFGHEDTDRDRAMQLLQRSIMRRGDVIDSWTR